MPTDGLDQAILQFLHHGEATTGEIAGATRRPAGTVYGRCRRMQDRLGWLTSERRQGAGDPLFYCPLAGEVMTRENHDEIMALIAANPDNPGARLIPFHPWIRWWSLTPAGRAAAG